MAARGRPSARATLAGALVALALSAAACVGGGPQRQGEDAAPTATRRESPADPRLGEIADEIGCSETLPADPRGFDGALMCAVDGEIATRIHAFEPSDRTSVERRFAEAFGDSRMGGVECDGNIYRFVVLGDDWLVTTNDHAVAGNLVVNLRAEFIGPDGVPARTSDVADVCR
jgi:hypothetical protein